MYSYFCITEYRIWETKSSLYHFFPELLQNVPATVMVHPWFIFIHIHKSFLSNSVFLPFFVDIFALFGFCVASAFQTNHTFLHFYPIDQSQVKLSFLNIVPSWAALGLHQNINISFWSIGDRYNFHRSSDSKTT